MDSGFHALDYGFRVLDSGFRIPDSGFRIPAQWIPDSKKGWIPIFTVLMLFFAFRFRVRLLRNFRFINYGLNVLQFRKGLWYNKQGGTLGDCPHRNTAKPENNKHSITAKKRSETPTSQF